MAVQLYSATAPIKALAGTEASPGITFTGGDTDTGIYSPAANQLGITTGGTSKLIIDENGSLQVVGGTKDNPAIYFDGGTGIYSPGADQVAISTNGAQKIIVDANGNVGIGGNGTGSSLGVYLQKGGDASAHFYEASDGTKKMIAGVDSGLDYIKIGSLSNHPVGLVANNAEKIRITTDGKVGLGTSSPSALFHSVNTSAGAATVAAAIQNSSLTINTEVRLALSPNSAPITDSRYAYVGSVNEIGSTSVALTFGTGAGAPPTERLRITSAGVLQIADAGDIAVGTTTGTKIGTATSQKIGFYNATPVVQPTTGVAEAAFVENSGGTAVNVDSTFGGYTIQQVVEALQTLGLLA